MEFSLQVIDYELAQARAVLERPDVSSAGNLVEVKSPVSGRVLKVMQESETVVSPGMQILEIGDPTDIEIEAEILSRDAVAIHPGDSVEIEQWGGENPLKGRVRRIEPAAFTKISALGVEEQRVYVLSDLIDPPEAAKALGDRYRVEVRVAVWHSDDVLAVPAGALFREGNTWKTFVYQDGSARLTTIEAGHSDGRLTEVLSGLKPGDKVLLHPPDTVKDGTRRERARRLRIGRETPYLTGHSGGSMFQSHENVHYECHGNVVCGVDRRIHCPIEILGNLRGSRHAK